MELSRPPGSMEPLAYAGGSNASGPVRERPQQGEGRLLGTLGV